MNLITTEFEYRIAVFRTQLKTLRKVVKEIENAISLNRLDKKVLAQRMKMSNKKFNLRLNSQGFSVTEIIELAELINTMMDEKEMK